VLARVLFSFFFFVARAATTTEGQELKDAIRKQVEHYLSKHNLSTDVYLVSHMDEQMSVPLSLLASFKLLSLLTTNVDAILDAVKDSKDLILDESTQRVRPNI
jgi:La domain